MERQVQVTLQVREGLQPTVEQPRVELRVSEAHHRLLALEAMEGQLWLKGPQAPAVLR